jgi:hypothetical protein
VRAFVDPACLNATLRFSNKREGPSLTFLHTLRSENECEGSRLPAHIHHHTLLADHPRSETHMTIPTISFALIVELCEREGAGGGETLRI